MINIKQLQHYLQNLQSQHPGVINNIFLSNSDNHILLSTKGRYSQSSVLATLLNDTISIIRLTLTGEQQDDKPLQMMAQTDNEITLAYNIGNNFIYGVTAKRSEVNAARQMASASYTEITRQFRQTKGVVDWVQAEQE